MPTITEQDREALDRANAMPGAEYGTRIWSNTALLALAAQREAFAAGQDGEAEPAAIAAPRREAPRWRVRDLALASLWMMAAVSMILLIGLYRRVPAGPQDQRAAPKAFIAIAPQAPVVATPPVVAPARPDEPPTRIATSGATSGAAPGWQRHRAAPRAAGGRTTAVERPATGSAAPPPTRTSEAGATRIVLPIEPAPAAEPAPPPGPSSAADSAVGHARDRTRISGIDAMRALRAR